MLEGLLVDLVPYGERFWTREQDWMNGPGAVLWMMGDNTPWSGARIKATREMIEGDARRGDPRQMWGIQLKDGHPIGKMALADVSLWNRTALLTALIGEPDYWGRGYGTDALLLLVEYVFGWLDMRKAWLETLSVNVRAGRQVRTLGFALEGCRRCAALLDGARQDVLVFGLLREQWPGRAALIERLGLAGLLRSDRSC